MASLQLPADVESWPAQRVVEYVLGEFPGRVALACSFQKEESVLLDMLFELEPNARVFAIDTQHLFPETYELWRAVESRYGTKIEAFAGDPVEDGLWETNPDLYLAIAKIEPLNRALLDLDAWITGIRRDQSPLRADAPKLGLGRAARALEGEPPRRLERRRLLGVHPRARPAVQQAARPGLRVDRRHALHASRQGARRDAGPGRSGPNAGCIHERVRPLVHRASRARARRRSRTTSSRSSSGAASSSTTSTATSSAPISRRASASRRRTATRTSRASAGSPRGSRAPARS